MFTGQDVVALRTKTGAGILDCKKALTETNGDMEKALDYLREKGIATAAKKSGRIASEGICYTEVRGNTAVLLEVNCESDFVSKGDMFKAFAVEVTDYIFNHDVKDVEEVITAMTETTTTAIQKIGENIKIRRFEKYVTENPVDTYIHMGGKIGVLVECSNGVSKETIHDIALQIAAQKPLYLTASDVPEEVLEKEKGILLQQIENDEKLASKPQAVKENMVKGKINKYYEENCLVDQAFVKDPAVKISDLLAKEKANVVRFTRFEMGEGLEKKSNDFEAEVNAQMKK